MTTEHEHDWAVSKHAGFGCRVCDASYWDWSRAELQRLSDLEAIRDDLLGEVEDLERKYTELLDRMESVK